jgi:hypothetical protein
MAASLIRKIGPQLLFHVFTPAARELQLIQGCPRIELYETRAGKGNRASRDAPRELTMDPKREQEVKSQVREILLQIALELEASAAGARGAAANIPDRELGMPYVQQLYSRLKEATFLLDKFKRVIDDALAEDK